MSTFSLDGFGRRTRLRGGAPGAGFRMRRAGRSLTGTICATGVSRSRTAIVSPRRTARRYSLSRAFSSAIPTCFMTHYDHKWSSSTTAAHLRPILGEPSTGPIRDKAASWTCSSRSRTMTGLAGMTNGPADTRLRPTARPKLVAHPRREIRAGLFGTADSPQHHAPTPRDAAPGDRSRPAAAGGLRRGCPFPRLFGGQGARAAHPVRVASQSTRGRGTRRRSRLPARLARRHAARRQHQATRRGACVPQRGARGGRLLPRHSAAEHSCSAGSMSPGPK